MKTLGIVIATPGRRSLARTLQSIHYQKTYVEDVLVVGDGYSKPTEELVGVFKDLGLPVRYQATTKTRDWGHSQINYGIQHVKGDYFTYQDDDDIYLPRALEEMARLCTSLDTPRPLLGRVKTPGWGLLWQRPGTNTVLDGHCLVAPNDKKRLGWMSPAYNGDQGLIHTTVRNYPELAWADRVWTLTRPEWKIMPWSTTQVVSHHWSWDFHRDGEWGSVASLQMRKDPDHDIMKARICALHPSVTDEELGHIAQFACFAAQGNDVDFNFEPGDRIESILPFQNYKEHTTTEYTHSWPPDFWAPPPQFEQLFDQEGNPLQDWRDDVWGGRPVA